jgi:nucleoside-diphosphate kinase
MVEQRSFVGQIKFERTFCMIKPDGVKRGVMGDIISRFERAGLKVVAIKMLNATEDQVRRHYPMSDEAWIERLGEKSLSALDHLDATPADVYGTENKGELGKIVADSLIEYLTSGPVVAMVIEGMQSVDMVRKLCGHTLPYKADVGTIRGDYSVDSPAVANVERRSIHNIIHASENTAEAENEIDLWFGDSEIPTYDLGSEAVMYAKYY